MSELRQRRPRFEDLTGLRFGILTAVEYKGRSGRNAAWLVRCDCGTQKIVKSTNLKRGQQSCGCLHRQRMSERNATHGLTRTGEHHPLYAVWDSMKRRCHGTAPDPYGRYRGRGITVCDRWRFGEDGITGFECFLSDMGPRPTPQHSIDRYPDNNGNYEPSNCRWATIVEQQRNRSSNHLVKFDGKQMTMTEAIGLSGLNEATVWGRLNIGWSEEKALTEAPRWRQPRVRDKAHCEFVRQLPCLITGRTDATEACHIRYADAAYRKRETGKGEKPSDRWIVPLHRDQHADQHRHGERGWWAKRGIDPLRIAQELYQVSGDTERAEQIISNARLTSVPKLPGD